MIGGDEARRERSIYVYSMTSLIINENYICREVLGVFGFWRVVQCGIILQEYECNDLYVYPWMCYDSGLHSTVY